MDDTTVCLHEKQLELDKLGADMSLGVHCSKYSTHIQGRGKTEYVGFGHILPCLFVVNDRQITARRKGEGTSELPSLSSLPPSHPNMNECLIIIKGASKIAVALCAHSG